MDYWNECIAQACEEAGVTATQEQVASIAASVKVAHENYGTAHGLDRLRDGRDEEIARLKMPDLNAHTIESAMSMVKGAARSMGIEVVE